jgi:hypothetical protein
MLPASSIEINVRALLATIAIVGLTVIIAGLVPALRIAAADPQQALRTGGDRGATDADSARSLCCSALSWRCP